MRDAPSKLEFGVFDHIEHMPGLSLDVLYDQRLEQLELYDQHGFFAYHLAEHHTPAVHSMAPSQNVFLAAAAQRTRRLRFGPGVYVLPLHHPLRLIEEVCMLDNLSKGRLEIGVGRGGVLEAYFWGQESDAESNLARYEETLEILVRGLSSDRLDFQGRFYRFDDVPMRLRPMQRPHPPLWYMRNPETAAQHGMSCILVGSLDNLEANRARFEKLWAQRSSESPKLSPVGEPKIGLLTHILLAETDQEAIDRAKPAWDAYRYNLGAPRRLEAKRRGLNQFLPTTNGDARNRAALPERHRAAEERRDLDATLEDLSEGERRERSERRKTPGGLGPAVIAGSPDRVRSYLDEYATCGANYCVFSFQWGDLSHEEAKRSIQLFVDELMPRYRTQPRITRGAPPRSSAARA